MNNIFKVATWNVNSLKVRLPHVVQWLEAEQPTVLALQETKVIDELFPVDELTDLGYKVCCSGQKTYNGVALLARSPITDICYALPELEDTQRRLLATTVGDVRIINVYVPNGSSVGSDKFLYKLNWFQHLTHFIQAQLQTYEKVIVLGDFNIAPAAEDVHDPVLWEGKVLFSEPERQALEELMSVGLVDSFRLFPQPEQQFSWWDYRAGALWRNHGLRIDHILISKALIPYCQACYIDKAPRKWKRPSDHAPVVAEFAIDFFPS